MTDFEYLESIGQASIFDYLEITPTSSRNRGFVEGDKVKLRLYTDEVDYVRESLPHLMEVGVVTEVFDGFYSVKFDHETLKIDGEKLLLI